MKSSFDIKGALSIFFKIMSNSTYTERLLITKSAKTGFALGKLGLVVGKWSAFWLWRLGLAGTLSMLGYMKLMINSPKEEYSELDHYLLENIADIDNKEALLRYVKDHIDTNKLE
jgi:hypothetical protein